MYEEDRLDPLEAPPEWVEDYWEMLDMWRNWPLDEEEPKGDKKHECSDNKDRPRFSDEPGGCTVDSASGRGPVTSSGDPRIIVIYL